MSTEEVTTPALFYHCTDAYREMMARANRVELDEGTEGIVYEGFITTFFKDELKLSVPYFSSVTKALTKMGCARQLRKGGSSTPSQWLMITEPTLELFLDYQDRYLAERVRYVTTIQHEGLQQQVRDLTARVNELEKLRDVLLAGEEELVS